MSAPRDAPRSPLRGWSEAAAPGRARSPGREGEAAAPFSCGAAGTGGTCRAARPVRRGRRGRGRGGRYCLPATCAPSRRGKCWSCYSSFHSFPSALPLWTRPWERFPQSLPAPPPGAAGVGSRPAGARTMPAACVGRRGRGGHDALESPPCPPPGNTTIFKPAPLNQQEALKIEQPGLGGGD